MGMIKIHKKAPPGVKSVLEQRGATKALPKEPPPEDSPEAEALAFVFGTAYLVGAADGELSDEEYDVLGQMLADITELPITGEQLDALLDAADSALEQHGFEGALDALASMQEDPDLRRSAYAIAVAVGCADGVLTDEETSMFAALADAFDIAEDEAEAIIEECIAAYAAG
jgi:uncharacterized tellurite resistance protein B-like protein